MAGGTSGAVDSVAVIGGSIAGCAAAVVLHRAGARRVVVHERATAELADRGVGVAVHTERCAELLAAGLLDEAVPWEPMRVRHWYVRDGSSALGRVVGSQPLPFRAYGWGHLWQALRARVPREVEFRTGSVVRAIAAGPDGVAVRGTGGEERYAAVVGADGHASLVRDHLHPGLTPSPAGYPAWRGACPEERLRGLGDRADGVCAYVVFDGGHMVVYRIPDGRGGRLVNWVLYATVPGAMAASRTLDAAHRERLDEITDELLPPFWGELIRRTGPDSVFLQRLYDVTAPRYSSGRLLLLGDAATVARPHTGAGAVKALQDVAVLESSLAGAGSWASAAGAYDAARAPVGRAMTALGRRLGRGLVEATPAWRAQDGAALDSWWEELAGQGGFGGRELAR
ncbi:FAD-dependent monooxygenase [Streptomyces sp. BBFR102]|uniref:FAD-dependent monooxygenase n=1 Tax=Streptomyces sp. BBFR102 TaxID=3448171 RepID=UPI003F52AF20